MVVTTIISTTVTMVVVDRHDHAYEARTSKKKGSKLLFFCHQVRYHAINKKKSDEAGLLVGRQLVSTEQVYLRSTGLYKMFVFVVYGIGVIGTRDQVWLSPV